MKIGFFDSGIGGITVLNEALKMLPNEEYIYYADSINAPYGIKPKEVVKKYIYNVVQFLISKKVDVLVIACNTATSIAVRELRQVYDIPIIGMEPAVKYAVEHNKNKRILVTATDLTLKEEKFKNLVERVDSDSIVDSLALPKLVEYAEDFIFDKNKIVSYLRKQLEPFDLDKYGSIVLGCTHFPFYKSQFREIIPEHVKIVDGNVGTVRHLKDIMERSDKSFSSNRKLTFYYSGVKDEDNMILKKYLNILNLPEKTY
ncbi:glutamate racemase 2 [Vallitalea longa]|uniref:Glutamate racemase n=1 Tax=Vallitalea longa TaxID=2936439 RepID=A0A9W5Y9E9_9FIRM|nr:glutamate racemase [Vallitalea longa]GKX27819.1 glutamate racemase 2 [Vallitalea longa]